MSSDFDEETCDCGQCNGVGEVDDYEYDGYDEDPEDDGTCGCKQCRKDQPGDVMPEIYAVEDEYGDMVWISAVEYEKRRELNNAATIYGVMVVTWLLALFLEGDAV